MKTSRQKSNWILDAVLFTGFLVAFAMDWTGLELHQWIGVIGGLVAIYHLVLHWDWVVTVTMRFFGKTSGQARTYYLLDASIMLGFYLILVTGLVMSTWLNLELLNYSTWVDFHVTTSIVTLALVVLKIGLHGRWIVRVARQSIFCQSAPVVAQSAKLLPVTQAVPVPANAVTRRDFLKMMGIVSAASLAAFAFTMNNNQAAQAATTENASATQQSTEVAQATAQPTSASTSTSSSVSTAQATPTSTTTATAESVSVLQTNTTTTSCMVRCDKHCAFPGHCRKYQDSNANGYCDLGECA